LKLFSPAFFTVPPPPAEKAPLQPADKLKRLQCEALWTKWRLHQAAPGCFYFLHMDSDAERCPSSGYFSMTDAERFIHAREREQQLW